MLRKIMKKFKAKRTHGTDWIDKYSLKLASPLIEDSLLHLVNLSIREGRFSSRWKPQLIFPHHKKKEKDLLQNYRPVSHLVHVGLTVEYVVYYQIDHKVRSFPPQSPRNDTQPLNSHSTHSTRGSVARSCRKERAVSCVLTRAECRI